MKMRNDLLEKLLHLAIAEDIGDGDHTSLATLPSDSRNSAKLLVKEAGIIAGVEIAEKIFYKLDSGSEMQFFLKDGDTVNIGDVVFTVKCRTIALLQAERLVLNFMQRMSGIATQTRLYVDQIEGTGATILDTRKTTPGLRIIEKMAVKIGGGDNHRMGLYDMIMIKDNHVDYAGGLENAIRSTEAYLKNTDRKLPVEVEVRSLADITKVLEIGGVDRVMFDNFSVEDTKRGVELVNGKLEIESSGGITMETIRDYAECGVDYISVGALTHQIKSLDLSLKAILRK